MSMYHPDRLKYPMITGQDGKFKRVTWDQALDITNKFKDFSKNTEKIQLLFMAPANA